MTKRRHRRRKKIAYVNEGVRRSAPRFAKMIEQTVGILGRKWQNTRLAETLSKWREKALDADMDDLWNEVKKNLTAKGMSDEEADRLIKEVRAEAKKREEAEEE